MQGDHELTLVEKSWRSKEVVLAQFLIDQLVRIWGLNIFDNKGFLLIPFYIPSTVKI